MRFILKQRDGEITLIPITKYENPTEALSDCIKPDQPIDEPKKVARMHIWERLVEGIR